MPSEVLVAILSLIGTFIGTIGGILASQKLISYRIGQLENKVDKHNTLIDRMYKIESRVTLLEDEIKIKGGN